jgi:hypothetical protein
MSNLLSWCGKAPRVLQIHCRNDAIDISQANRLRQYRRYVDIGRNSRSRLGNPRPVTIKNTGLEANSDVLRATSRSLVSGISKSHNTTSWPRPYPAISPRTWHRLSVRSDERLATEGERTLQESALERVTVRRTMWKAAICAPPWPTRSSSRLQANLR